MFIKILLSRLRTLPIGGTILAFSALIVGLSCASFAAEPFEKYSCETGYFLNRWIGSDGVQTVSWFREIESMGQKMKVGFGYMKGHKIRLGDLALWGDRQVAERGVWIFQGIGNSITEMEILILNEHNKKVGIVDVGTMKSDVYQCELVAGN